MSNICEFYLSGSKGSFNETRMLCVTVETKWLLSALSPNKKRPTLPRLIVDNNTMSVQHFYDGGSGMRATSKLLTTNNDNMCFEMSETVRRFLSCCSSFKSVTFHLNGSGLTMLLESSCSALQYNMPYVKVVPLLSMPKSEQDIELRVPTEEWLNVWHTIPVKGDVEIACTARRRAITLKHSKGRWGCAVQASDVACKNASFVCDSRVAKAVFVDVVASGAFCSLVLKANGVMCCQVGNVTVFLSPKV